MQQSCKTCGKSFDLHPLEQRVLAELHLSNPSRCPNCRRQQRLYFRNFFNLYHRQCDLSGKKIISMYDQGTPFPVYDMQEWWSDKWDPLSYGIDIDFSKPFFEQVGYLHRTVPRTAFVNVQSENSDYSGFSLGSRNCYLVFGNVQNEDCAYGHIVWQSKDCFDCLYVYRSERCYECIDCVQCYGLAFSRDCDNCSDSQFLVHCVGCRNCFGCVGLRNKEYHIFNEPHSREEYLKKIAELNTGSHRTVELAREQVKKLTGKEIVKYYHGFNCENVQGDYLYNCRNIHEGYDLKNCEDCCHCATLESFSDCVDCNFAAVKSELCYQCLTSYGDRLVSCHCCMSVCSECSYCDNCYSCKHCLGCVGLKNKEYCILNRQYTKAQFEELVPRIIDHMKKNGEWGEFFPKSLSPFGYNETMAMEYFPLTKEEALSHGWQWKDQEDKQQNYLGPAVEIPDDIRQIDDTISEKILRCEVTGKLYKVIPQELKFYREIRLPLPRKCFEQRQRERFALRNPRHLWDRKCARCSKNIQATYAPDRPEIVYCEDCYLNAVY